VALKIKLIVVKRIVFKQVPSSPPPKYSSGARDKHPASWASGVCPWSTIWPGFRRCSPYERSYIAINNGFEIIEDKDWKGKSDLEWTKPWME
jgi:hypothetical protein